MCRRSVIKVRMVTPATRNNGQHPGCAAAQAAAVHTVGNHAASSPKAVHGLESSLLSARQQAHGLAEPELLRPMAPELCSRSFLRPQRTPKNPPARSVPALSASELSTGQSPPSQLFMGCFPSYRASRDHFIIFQKVHKVFPGDSDWICYVLYSRRNASRSGARSY